ncbi:HAD family phosphatase [Paraeggerthella hongkongensis]|jgi:beta-phosphoglucomutase-like phosphatase (HAD superfamily)|uniref:HAD family hydrolase n=1 Tax=Paraeggerthella TaxID=651554 RepID=UPI001C108B34|nr:MULTISPECIES: HAD family phosphatase [Paraeggerthella]MBU5405478.1 HAD family phosphatase [Paraeggerthella hongkongensis]MCD2434208.1 HAD family phosphatase [Paraeggerthella hominis]
MNPSSIGIVFDCDGTLLDSMCVWREMEAELARRADVTLTEDDKDVLTTLTIPECGAFFHERFGLGASGKDVEDMVDEFMLDFYRTRVEARAGALAFVQELASRGVRMTVASSSPQLYLQAGLERCGFAPYFDAIVSVDDVNASKREPAVWDRARELMGTPRSFTWGMEDSVYAVHTLRKAGYRTLGIYDCDVSGTYEELVESCDHAVRTFDELEVEAFLAWNEAR